MNVIHLPDENAQINKVIYAIFTYLEIPSAGTVEFIPEPNAEPPF